MKNIMKLKHWQFFIILTCTIFISVFVAGFDLKAGDFDSMKLSAMLRVVGVIIFFIWLMILGLNLNKMTYNPYKFRPALFIAAIIFCAFGYIDLNLRLIFSENYIIPDFVSTLSSLLTFFGLIYVFYNLPKSLKSLESNRKVGFGECIPDAFFLFAFPIGVWFTQPRINELFATDGEKQTSNQQ